jgi:DNA-binding NarL/FixJ family response regulator
VLRKVLDLLPDEFDIVGTLESGAGLRTAIDEHHPDIVVLDITLPGQNGIVLASQLTGAGCQARIVFLSVHSDPDYVRAAMTAGAHGYVVKMRLALDLVPALRAALDGTRFVSPLPELDLE